MIIKNLLNILGIKKLEEKDPKDFRSTWNSTNWSSGQCCPKCKAWVYHNELMASICNSCGSVFQSILAFPYKSVRRIYYKGKWVWQVKYGVDDINIID